MEKNVGCKECGCDSVVHECACVTCLKCGASGCG
ncbi:Uncharacterised protein [uncultured archaeon]|nr:Uncharacterised protein [uncultured archaeon]